ncbi:MAG: LysR substrate-binding domain-containing protein [Pseudomonadota bacterium]
MTANSLLDIEQLRTLVAIAETGNFTRAADEVSKTQSAVSMQMKRLEDTVGRPLFLKDGRQSKLTEAGHELVNYGRRILQLNSEAMSHFHGPQIDGAVRLGTPDDYAERFLPAILARFARTQPRVEVTVNCKSTPLLLESLNNHDMDLAIVTKTKPMPRMRVFRRERLFWVVAQHSNIWQENVIPLAMGQRECEFRQTACAALDAVKRPFRMAYSSWDFSAICAVILAGLAIGTSAESGLKPGMRVLTPQEGFPDLPGADIGVIHATGQLTPAAQALEEQIVSTLENAEHGRAAFK